MYDAFISHARQDASFAKSLRAALDSAGDRTSFADAGESGAGEAFWDLTVEAINGADAVLFVISPDSAAPAAHCHRELAHAVASGKWIVPIEHRPVPVDDLPEAIRSLSWVRRPNENDEAALVAEVCAKLDERPDWCRAHSRILSQASNWSRTGSPARLLGGEELLEAELWLRQPRHREPFPVDVQRQFIGRSRAQEEHRVDAAIGRQLAAQAALVLAGRDQTLEHSALIASQAASRVPTLEADHVLRQGLSLLPRLAAVCDHAPPVGAVAVIGAGSVLLVADGRGAVHRHDLDRSTSTPLAPAGSPVVALRGVLDDADREIVQLVRSTGRAERWAHDPSGLVENLSGTDVALASRERPLTLSPDGHTLVIGGAGGLRVHDITADEAGPVLHVPAGSTVVDVAFSADGQRLAAAAQRSVGEQIAFVWDLSSGGRRAFEHSAPVNAVALTDSGDRLACAWGTRGAPGSRPASSPLDARVAVWSLEDGSAVADLHLPQLPDSLAFDETGEMLAAGCRDGTARIWHVGRRAEVARAIHQRPVRLVSLRSRDELPLLVSASAGGQVTAGVAAPADPLLRLDLPVPVGDVALRPDGRFVLVAASGGQPGGDDNIDFDHRAGHVYDVSNGRLMFSLAHDEPVAAVGWSGDGGWIATGDRGGALLVRSAGNKAPISLEHAGAVGFVRFAPRYRGPPVMVGGGEGGVSLWDLPDGRLRATLPDRTGLVDAALAPDGHTAITLDREGQLRYWDVPSQQIVSEADQRVTAFAVSADWTRLAYASVAGTVALCSPRDVAAHSAPPATLVPAVDSAVSALRFSPDGRLLVAGAAGGTVSLWLVAEQREVARIEHLDRVTAASFTSDGRVLATGSTDRSVRISLCDPGDLVAELAGRTTRRLSAEEWRHLVGNEAHTPDREPPPFPPIDTAQQLVESPATPAPSGPQAEAPAGS